MTRSLKLRFKDLKNNSIFFIDLLNTELNPDILNILKIFTHPDDYQFRGQYIGFKDKHNIEIYEGDVVDLGIEIENIGEELVYKVVYEQDGFIFKRNDYNQLRPRIYAQDCLIIDNIYDNPRN